MKNTTESRFQLVVALLAGTAISFTLTNAIANRDGKLPWIAPVVSACTFYCINKKFQDQDEAVRAPFRYSFSRVNANSLAVTVRVIDFDSFGYWRRELKQMPGIVWAKNDHLVRENGKLVSIVTGYVQDTDTLTADEEAELDRLLLQAKVDSPYRRKPTLAYLGLCQHSAKYNPPNTSFEDCIDLAPEFLHERGNV